MYGYKFTHKILFLFHYSKNNISNKTKSDTKRGCANLEEISELVSCCRRITPLPEYRMNIESPIQVGGGFGIVDMKEDAPAKVRTGQDNTARQAQRGVR